MICMIKLGIICPSEIAFRRFMPALEGFKDKIVFVGIAMPSASERFSAIPSDDVLDKVLQEEKNKALKFVVTYGGKLFKSYDEIVKSNEIDAIYIPLPPALHYKWAKIALENGKHVLVEKPSTISGKDTEELVEIAKQSNLALHENYMFAFHDQLSFIDKYIGDGNIGDVRLYRISFGFPKRQSGDFRYIKSLGGGALIDAGGYTVKYARMLLGETAKVLYAKLNYTDEYDVDLYGSGALTNNRGDVVQIAFGMDNEYKCELEVWGSKGTINSGRILTAPAGFVPKMTVIKGGVSEVVELPSDDTFSKSIQRFIDCVENENVRNENYGVINNQARLFDEFLSKAK